jgi:hypothetical protein
VVGRHNRQLVMSPKLPSAFWIKRAVRAAVEDGLAPEESERPRPVREVEGNNGGHSRGARSILRTTRVDRADVSGHGYLRQELRRVREHDGAYESAGDSLIDRAGEVGAGAGEGFESALQVTTHAVSISTDPPDAQPVLERVERPNVAVDAEVRHVADRPGHVDHLLLCASAAGLDFGHCR